MPRLENKVVLVSGGASGIGAETARLVAREGGKAVLADLDEAKGRALAAELVPEQPDSARMNAVATNPPLQTRIRLLKLLLISSPRLIRNNCRRSRGARAIFEAKVSSCSGGV